MKRAKRILYLIEGPHACEEIALEKDSLIIGRSDPKSAWEPEVKLNDDGRVSRKHAHLFYKDGDWWIKDIGSKRGTFVDGEDIKGMNEPTKLSPGIPVRMGDTVWKIAPANFISKYWNGLSVEFQVFPAINYALHHCGFPVISNFVIRNPKASLSPPFTISISIPGYSEIWRKRIDPIPSGGEVILLRIDLNLTYESLHFEEVKEHEGKKRARLEIKFNDEALYNEKIFVLGFYEWPYDPAFRKSLACFVQPAHPLVQHLVAEAAIELRSQASVSSFTQLLREGTEYNIAHALQALYECFRTKYEIHYSLAHPSHEIESQVIRPPHRVIYDPPNKKGIGTCIDLALLMASCLENIYFQPLIFFVKEKEGEHAFLGCWTNIAERFEPILTDYERLENYLRNGRLILLETTGFTDRSFQENFKDCSTHLEKMVGKFSGRKPLYGEAKNLAELQFTSEKFIFALDVAAARQTVIPLQFPMNPQVIGIIRKAEELAMEEKGNPRLETRHLFSALLLKGSDLAKKILREAGGNLSHLEGLFTRSHMEEEISIRPTMNYRRAIEDARIIAGDTGVIFVEEKHLLYALLLSQSESVDQILKALGTNRKRAKEICDKYFDWTVLVWSTHFEK